MTEQLQRTLTPVRTRQRLATALRGMIAGLLVAALAALLVETLRRWQAWWLSPFPGLTLLIIGPAIGAITGWLRHHPWTAAAAAIDAHYGLKDRTSSALAFEHTGHQPSPLESLAIADAEAHLSTVDPRQVAPLRLPGRWWQAAAALALALVVVFWPGRAQPAGANIPLAPIPGIVEEAEKIEEEIKQLEALARKEEDPQVRELAEKLRDAAEAMKQPGVDVKEALAQLSQMQAMLAQQQAQFNLALTDAQLADAGDAMTDAESLKDIGDALKQKQFDKAGDKLEALAEMPKNPAAEQKLRASANKMQKAGLGEMAGATADLADAMASGEGGGGKNLGKLVRRHGRRKSMDKWMMQQLARLNESKSNCLACQGGACKACNGKGCSSCSGTGMSMSLAQGSSGARSNNPSRKWGAGASGNPQGEPTNLGGTRNLQQITGAMGDGPVDSETLHSPEAKQLAGRKYRDAYDQYQKLSESVLESEPIPLGHRQTIRRYFESIRPSDAAEITDSDGK